MNKDRKYSLSKVLALFTENFGLSRTLSLVVVCFISLVVCLAIYWFIHSAPPRILTITSGPPGSTFERNAEKYRAILARNGVTLKILPSQGSLENLQRLETPSSGVDIGFVQGGVADGTNTQKVVSRAMFITNRCSFFIAPPGLLDCYPNWTESDWPSVRWAVGLIHWL